MADNEPNRLSVKEIIGRINEDATTSGISTSPIKRASPGDHMFKIHDLEQMEVVELLAGANVPSIPLVLPGDREYDPKTRKVTKIELQEGDERDRMHIIPEAQDMLRQIADSISVIAIVGPARTGKSYILSRLLGKHDAFSLGMTVDPETFGIWIGTHGLKGKTKNGTTFITLLLDTEGIDAAGAEGAQDARIVILTILLASKLIYNSTSVPRKTDLQKLQCFANLASNIQIRKGEDTGLKDDRHFPEFLWLFRDAFLKLNDGQTITDYLLEKVLCDPTNAASAAVLKLFSKFEAFRLPPPHMDPEIVQKIDVHYDEVQEIFKEGVDELLGILMKNAKAVQKRGYNELSTVNGEALSIMLGQYVRALNDPKSVPALDDTWKYVVEVTINENTERFLKEYECIMEEKVKVATNDWTIPLEEDKYENNDSESTIKGIHSKVYSQCEDALINKTRHLGMADKDGNPTDTMRNILENLKSKLIERDEADKVTGGVLFDKFLKKNSLLSRKFCENLFHKKFEPIKTKMRNLKTYTFEELCQDMVDLERNYNTEAKGPEKIQVYEELDEKVMKTNQAMYKEMTDYRQEFMEEIKKVKKEEIESIKKLKADMDAINAKEEMLAERESTANKLDSENKAKLKQQEYEAKRKEEEAQRKIEGLKKAKLEEEAKLKAELEILRREAEDNRMKALIEKTDKRIAEREREEEERRHIARQFAEAAENYKGVSGHLWDAGASTLKAAASPFKSLYDALSG